MAELSIELIRTYCRIDYEDEDDVVQLMWDAAVQYITEAVGTYEPDDPVMKLLTLTLVNGMYETRTYTVTDEQKQNYTTLTMMRQLQLKYGEENENES